MTFKDFLKLTAFVEFLTLIVWSIMFVGSMVLKIDGMSVMQLFLVMGIVLGACILTMIVVPLAEWWLS